MMKLTSENGLSAPPRLGRALNFRGRTAAGRKGNAQLDKPLFFYHSFSEFDKKSNFKLRRLSVSISYQ
jgi:hypothetical protein